MSRAIVISALTALACHALLLFGLRLETRAMPLPVADDAVEVSLVPTTPPSPAPAAPEPPPTEPPPPPALVPEPILSHRPRNR